MTEISDSDFGKPAKGSARHHGERDTSVNKSPTADHAIRQGLIYGGIDIEIPQDQRTFGEVIAYGVERQRAAAARRKSRKKFFLTVMAWGGGMCGTIAGAWLLKWLGPG